MLVAALALLVGCGTAPEAIAPTVVVPTAQATIVPPTKIPEPTEAPTTALQTTAATRPAGPGLGISRAEIQARFEATPFNMVFTEVEPVEGRATVEGTSGTKGITIALYGPPEDVQEAQAQITVGDQGAPSADAARYMIALLEVTAPNISNPTAWLKTHLDQAIKGESGTTIEGDRTIMFILAPEIKFMLMSVQRVP